MRRRNVALTLLCLAPLAMGAVACGDDDDRSALEDDELARELDMALGSDTGATTFEDTALIDSPDAEPDPEPQRQAQAPRTQTPRQQQPRTTPDEPRQTRPQPRTVTLSVPVGTTVALRMNEELSTERNQAGDAFTARLENPIVNADGLIIVPAGATVRGRVTAVAPSTRVGQTAAMKLAFEAITFGGESYPLQATVQSADVEQSSRTSAAETAGKVAAGAAAGAILGQVLGKDTESTLQGAAIGAAAGTAIAMGTADVDAVLPRDAEVIIRIDEPITITRTVTN